MAQFRIIESRPATQYWEYLVEADTETEALNKVLDGNVEADEYEVDSADEDIESEFEVWPAELFGSPRQHK